MDVKFKGSVTVTHGDTIEVDATQGYHGEVFVNVGVANLLNFWNDEVSIDYFKPGMMVEFNTNGIMALSLPPRVSALEFKEVRNLMLLVIKVEDSNVARIVDESSVYNNHEVIVNSDEGVVLEVGRMYVVAYNGIMTRSIPPHIYIEDYKEVIE